MARETLYGLSGRVNTDSISKTWLDIDTYDTEFDICVTVCIDIKRGKNLDSLEPYDKFNNLLVRKVFVESTDKNIVCNWSGFVKKNMALFKAYSEQNWIRTYDDDDTTIYEWLKDFHLLMAGYGDDTIYKSLNDLLVKCKR